MKSRYLAIALVLGLILVAAFAISPLVGRMNAPPQQAGLVGGPFHLVDTDGRPVDDRVLKGKWSAVFFGFTYCPDACPMTLGGLAQAEALLGPKAKTFQTVFISLDPARDTPAQMKTYLSNDAFPKSLIGLTGTQAQTDAAAKAYRVYHQKNGEGPGYLVDHSVVTYLMNPEGVFACVIPNGLTPEQTADRIRNAMRQGPDVQSC